jgi:hypothetical protein
MVILARPVSQEAKENLARQGLLAKEDTKGTLEPRVQPATLAPKVPRDPRALLEI